VWGSMDDNAQSKVLEGRDDKGQFKLGHIGKGGRPKGSRNKLVAPVIENDGNF
jgi:hypothetical protein